MDNKQEIKEELELGVDVDPEKLPPELKALWDSTYKKMQAGWTKKTTELAELRKGFEEKIAKYEESIKQQNAYIQELLDANRDLAELYETSFKQVQSQHDETKPKFKGKDGIDMVERDEAEKLSLMVTKLQQELENTKKLNDKQISYILQLVDITRKAGPDLDVKGLLETAAKKGYQDLYAAYDDITKDERFNAAVKAEIEKLKPQIEAELKKTLIPHSGGAAPSIFDGLKFDGPVKYEDISDKILRGGSGGK